jgi:hypothetical protein
VTLPEHCKGHHLHQERQDLFQHQWQEGEIHFQEQDIAISCASTDVVHLREHDRGKEEQQQEEEQAATSGDVKMINSIHIEYNHLLVSPYLNK